MPDVLPMPETADTDNNADTITVENKYPDYSGDIYSYMNLDSQTAVEIGDFFAFYTGELGVESGDSAASLTGYGRITTEEDNSDGTTTIAFVAATWEEVESCMAVYAEETMSGEELLAGVDTGNMESEIEQQAYNSGFAEEAAMYLASLALSTDNFNELSEHVNMEDYKVTLTDGTPISPEQLQLMSGGSVKVEIEETSVKAKVGTKPTHLGNIAGTSADAVWDVAFIIPYISDIKVSANVGTMNYTAVSFNATMSTKENEEDTDDGDIVGKALDISEEIKEWLEFMDEGGMQSDDFQDKLVERYSEMLSAESDWIRIIEYNIVEVKKSVPFGILLITIGFEVNFVVEMDASITKKYGASITLPRPARAGYGFKGWNNGDASYSEAFMGAADLTLTAQWEAGKIGYTVNYYQQNADGSEAYTLVKTINGTADMDSVVTPEPECYEGFTAPENITLTITADEAANVVNYYYTRNQYTLTWDMGIGSADGQTYTEGKVYYGENIAAPDSVKTGYSYEWDAVPVTTMPAGDLTYTANWTPNVYQISFNTNGGTARKYTVEI